MPRTETRRRLYLTLIAAVVLSLLSASAAQAAFCTDTFTGPPLQAGGHADTGAWNDPTAWSGGYVPDNNPSGQCTSGTNAVIPSPKQVSLQPAVIGGQNVNNGGAYSLVVSQGATLSVSAGSYTQGGNAVATVLGIGAGGMSNAGTLRLVSTGAGDNATVDGSSTFTNSGTILSNVPAGTSGIPNSIQGFTLTNHGTIETVVGGMQLQLANHPAVNSSDGTLKADASSTLLLTNPGGNGAEFDAGGTITANGTVEIGGGTTFVAGSVAAGGAHPVQVDGSTVLDLGGTGTGTFALAQGANPAIAAELAAGFTLTVPSGGQLQPSVTNGSLRVDGALSLTGTDSSHDAYASLPIDNHGTLTATGTGGGQVDFQNGLSNSGTTEISGAAYDQGPTTQADGTLTVDSGATFDPGALHLSGGTLHNSGAVTDSGGGLVATGGAITGTPPYFTGGTINLSGAGTGTIDTQNVVLGSDLPSGYDVIVESDLQIANATATNDGTIELRGTDSLHPNVYNGALDNQGTITTDASATPYRVINSALTNEGTIDAAASLSIANPFTNAGRINVSGGSTLDTGGNAFTQTSGTTTVTGAMDVLAAPTVTISGGTLAGAGTVQGNLTNAGTVAPTAASPSLRVNGTYTQDSSGFLATDVEAGGTGTLTATGAATLAGTLQVSTGSVYAPPAGQTYDVIDAASRTGTFTTTAGLQSGPYTLTYPSTGAVLTAQGRPVTPPPPGNPPPAPSLAIGDATVANPGSGSVTASFTLTLSSAASTPVTVSYATANGSAAAPDDYRGASGTVTFAPGQTTATVPVTVFGTGRAGSARTFFVNLSAPSGATLSVARGTGTILGRLALQSVAPGAAGNGGSTIVTLRGAGLSGDDAVALTAPGRPAITGTAISADPDGRTLTAAVDLRGAAVGARTVTVTAGSDTQSLTNAFSVQRATPPDIVAEVQGPPNAHPDVPWTGRVYFENLGNTDAYNVGLEIDGLPSGDAASVTGAGVADPVIGDDGQAQTVTVVIPRISANSTGSLTLQFTTTSRNAHVPVASIGVNVLDDGNPGLSPTPAVSVTPLSANLTGGRFTGSVAVQSAGRGGTITYDVHTGPAPIGASAAQVSDQIVGGHEVLRAALPPQRDGCFVVGDPSADVLSWNCSHVSTPSCVFTRGGCTGAIVRGRDLARPRARIADVSGDVWEYVTAESSATLSDLYDKYAVSDALRLINQKRRGVLSCLIARGFLRNRTAVEQSRVDNLRRLADGTETWLSAANLRSKLIGKLPESFQQEVATKLFETMDAELAPAFDQSLAAALAADAAPTSDDPNRFNAFTSLEGQGTSAAHNWKAYQALVNRYCFQRTRRRSGRLQVVVTYPSDPNAMSGPAGPGARHYLTGARRPYVYLAQFENMPNATAAASRVTVRDQLDIRRLDPGTATLGPITFGPHVITPPPGLQQYATIVDLRPGTDALVSVSGSVNRSTGLISWTLQSIDPVSHQPVIDGAAGFLPPDTAAANGEGSVSFSAYPTVAGQRPGAATRNLATIMFDTNAPISTPTWLNVIDRSRPSGRARGIRSRTIRVGRRRRHQLVISLTGRDSGSGVASYDVYAARGRGRLALIAAAWPRRRLFVGCSRGVRYRVAVVARDRVGNTQTRRWVSRPVRCR